MDNLTYQPGYNNTFESEALPGALPKTQNSPQTCPYGLYAEQLSGSAFTVPRAQNLKTWLYRILPSVGHEPFELVRGHHGLVKNLSTDLEYSPSQTRFNPFPIPSEPTNFVAGLHLLAGAGDPAMKNGISIHMYLANENMQHSSFYNSDGDFLIVPQQGRLDIRTEMGLLQVSPNEIFILPRGIKCQVNLPDGPSRGYILEVFNGHFELPDLGPIGANGLANPRHFLYPVAAFEKPEDQKPHCLFNKYMNQMWVACQPHSPFDVVAWSGNYAPCKYDLALFTVINSVSFDHPDPSIFTVLTCKSAIPGVAIADFAIFPPRWMVAEHTFRPPYFHRNVMSEFMGNICGQYEAKLEGFLPGGASLHSTTSAHGPDQEAFDAASKANLVPVKSTSTSMSFMFESSLMMGTSKFAMETSGTLQPNYWKCWAGMRSNFNHSHP